MSVFPLSEEMKDQLFLERHGYWEQNEIPQWAINILGGADTFSISARKELDLREKVIMKLAELITDAYIDTRYNGKTAEQIIQQAVKEVNNET